LSLVFRVAAPSRFFEGAEGLVAFTIPGFDSIRFRSVPGIFAGDPHHWCLFCGCARHRTVGGRLPASNVNRRVAQPLGLNFRVAAPSWFFEGAESLVDITIPRVDSIRFPSVSGGWRSLWELNLRINPLLIGGKRSQDPDPSKPKGRPPGKAKPDTRRRRTGVVSSDWERSSKKSAKGWATRR
jgi:hypothetical protein